MGISFKYKSHKTTLTGEFTSNKSAVEAREEAKLLLNKPELQLSFREIDINNLKSGSMN